MWINVCNWDILWHYLETSALMTWCSILNPRNWTCPVFFDHQTLVLKSWRTWLLTRQQHKNISCNALDLVFILITPLFRTNRSESHSCGGSPVVFRTPHMVQIWPCVQTGNLSCLCLGEIHKNAQKTVFFFTWDCCYSYHRYSQFIKQE